VSRVVKILIGLAVALLAGWISHGPLGRGAAYIDRLEADARTQVTRAEVPGVTVVMSRQPLARVALLSGPANDFQRRGMGSLPGLDGRVLLVPGMSAVDWEREGRVVPLIAETLGLTALAWLIGLGIGWLIFRPRRKREGFL
jgi:hypothetical protein